MLGDILTAIASIGAIVSGLVWIIRQLKSTQEQANQDIDKKVNEEKEDVLKGGRPKW